MLSIPSKRSSVSSSKPIEEDHERIERSVDYLKLSLQKHLKDKQMLFDESEMKELYKITKNVLQSIKVIQ
jgi:hypothetical protein